MIDVEKIRSAHRGSAPYIRRTPLISGGYETGEGGDQDIRLKLESLQPTGSFKVRGFAAAAVALSPEMLQKGIITVSAGNAALAAAYVASRLGVPCRTIMPDTASRLKVDGVRRLGGETILLPRDQFLAWIANRSWEQEPKTFIHPFADEAVIAGHGGIGMEIVEDLPTVGRVLIPVGGGGLIVGVASALKALRPEVEVVGVQSDGYPLWPKSLVAGGPVQLTPNTIADGTTAPFHATMFERLKGIVDRWIVVPERRLRATVAELATTNKIVVEGAGALGYAALDQLPDGPPTVILISGGNISAELLAQLLTE